MRRVCKCLPIFVCFVAVLLFTSPTTCSGYNFRTCIPLPNGSSLPVHCFLPQQGARGPLPAVIVGVGVGSQKILQYQEHCAHLANRNFVVVLIDPANYPEELVPGPFSWDKGVGYVIGSINQGIVAARLRVSLQGYLDSIRATVDFLCRWTAVDCSRIVLSGHSQPANAALTYACNDPRIKAVIWNYGGWPWIMPYDPLKLPPVQIFHGDQDDVYDVKYARQLALDLQSTMRCYELNIYPGQKHMFNVYYDLRTENRFMKPALLDAFERLVCFLNRVLHISYIPPPPPPPPKRRPVATSQARTSQRFTR